MKKILFFLLITILLDGCQNDDHTEMVTTNTPLIPNIAAEVSVYNAEEFLNGFTLIAPFSSKNIYLIDMEGAVVNQWHSQYNGIANYLDEDGYLYRTYSIPNPNFSFGGRTGGIEKFDFDGNLVWYWEYSTEQYTLHHDLALLPNGNLLLSVWDLKSADEAIENGRDPSLLLDSAVWPERIIEIMPQGSNSAQIVWQWSLWDHLIQDHDDTKDNFGSVSEHPEKIDINYTIGDANLTHVNSLFYIEELDQVVFSSRRFNELMIIDHSTTFAEAASSEGGRYGKGGDLLYRWGNPEAYKSGTASDKKLFGQHDVRWIGNLPKNGNGNFLVFNNDRQVDQSSIDEIEIPQNEDGSYDLQPNEVNLPYDYSWSYLNAEIYAPRISGAQRLINGNTLITEGTEGVLYELNNQEEVVWKYTIPLTINDVFKAFRYPIDYPAFHNRNLVPLEEVVIE